MPNIITRHLAEFVLRSLGPVRLGEVLQITEADLRSMGGFVDIRESKRLNTKQLYLAYHKKPFVKSIVNIFLSFLTAGGGFSIVSDVEEIEKELNAFWHAAKITRDFKRAAREAILTGNSYIGLTGAGFGDKPVERGGGEQETSLVVFGSDQVVIHFDPFLNRPIKFVVNVTITQEKGETKKRAGKYVITLTDDKIILEDSNGKKKSDDHPFRYPPLVHVAEDKMLNEIYGRGAIDEALYNRIENYEDVLISSVRWLKYHGGASPVITGLKNPRGFMKVLLGGGGGDAQTKPWVLGKLLGLGEGQDVKFLESSRGIADFIELLKIIYHQIVVDSRVPEFLFGVHMNAAQASTREQLVNILKTNEERRETWAVAIQEINRLYQLKRRGKAEETDVLWGPAELNSMKERVEVVALLISIGALSHETAMRQFPELIPLIDRELKCIEQEQAKELSPYNSNEFNIKTVSTLVQFLEQAKRNDGFAKELLETIGYTSNVVAKVEDLNALS